MSDDMKKISLIVPPEQDGERLDSAISKLDCEVSRNLAQNLILKGAVYIEGKPAKSKKVKVKAGEEIFIEFTPEKDEDIRAEEIELNIIYEDDDLLIVNKPRGMVVHPGNGNYTKTLVNGLKFRYGKNLSNLNGEDRPGIVHRIDKDTAGLLIVTKNNKSHESIARQLREHSVTRRYIGLAYDNIKEDDLIIDKPIGRDLKNRLRRQVDGSNPKYAVTQIHVLERFGRYTLFQAELKTGRTHQIRVHMAYIKHPLVGDTLYGMPKKKQLFQIDGQLLYAKTIGFVHPRTGEYMEFNSELPDFFTDVLKKLREASRD